MTMWEDVKKNLMEWYSVTSDKTVEVAKVTSLRYDKFGISRDIERQFSELGNLVYTALKDGRGDILDDSRVAALVSKLDGLEQELHAKEAEIERIRSQHSNRQPKEHAATVDQAVVVQPVGEAPDPEARVEEPAATPAETSREAASGSENADHMDP